MNTVYESPCFVHAPELVFWPPTPEVSDEQRRRRTLGLRTASRGLAVMPSRGATDSGTSPSVPHRRERDFLDVLQALGPAMLSAVGVYFTATFQSRDQTRQSEIA